MKLLSSLTTNSAPPAVSGVFIVKQTTEGSGFSLQAPAGNGLNPFTIATEPDYGGVFWLIKTLSRLDISAAQLFLSASNGIVFSGGNTAIGRVADSSSIATQKDSYGMVFENALYISGGNTYRYSGWISKANTSVAGATSMRLQIGAQYLTDMDYLAITAAEFFSDGRFKLMKSPTVITSDVSTALTTLADITGLSFDIVAGTYSFKFVIRYTCNATTTGSWWALNTSATITSLVYSVDSSLTTTTRYMSEGLAAVNAGSASTSSATTGSNIAIVEGIITVSTSGTITGRFASEVAVSNGIVAKAGSFVEFIRLS